MANPYTQGLRYNYKPLDLSTIGKAAVMNQGQYDQTQSALDEFDVSINALSQQEEWARGEESKYREKIDALSDGLAQSKDPRASMRQLQKLNKEYKRRTGPGGDIGIVEGNVATMQDYRKRHQKMIADGKNVPANFNTFLSMQMEGFKGFDDEGKLQSLGLQDMTENKSEEMMDRAIELGKLSKADVKMQLGKYASVGGFRKEAIDVKIEELNNEERAVYIQQVLANSAEFKPYLDQERSLIDYRNKGFDGETYMGNQLGTLDQNTAALKAQLAGKGLKENQKAAIQNNLNAIEQKRKELSQGIDKYGAMQYGQMLKSNAEYHNLTALPAGTANLMNYKEETYSRSGFTDEAAKMRQSHANAMARDKAKHKRDNEFALSQTPGGSNLQFKDMEPRGVDNRIKELQDPKYSAGLSATQISKNAEELRQLMVYKDVASKKSLAKFMTTNSKGIAASGVTPEELASGKEVDPAVELSQFIESKVNTQDLGKIANDGTYNGSAPEYTVDNDGKVYVKSYYEQFFTNATKSEQVYVGVLNSDKLAEFKKIQLKNKQIKEYKKDKRNYFTEGKATAFERYIPNTAAAAKKASANLKTTMNFNEYSNGSMTQEEFNTIKNSDKFNVTGVLHDDDLGRTLVSGTYGDDNTPFTLEPNHTRDNISGVQFGSSMNNLLNNYTSNSGESGQQLKNTISGSITYGSVIPAYSTPGTPISDAEFNRSSNEVNSYIPRVIQTDASGVPMYDNNNDAIYKEQPQVALQTVPGGTTLVRKNQNTGANEYLVINNKINERAWISENQLKDVGEGNSKIYRAVGNKTDAINLLTNKLK